jgi:hypothetical protein
LPLARATDPRNFGAAQVADLERQQDQQNNLLPLIEIVRGEWQDLAGEDFVVRNFVQEKLGLPSFHNCLNVLSRIRWHDNHVEGDTGFFWI